MTAFLMLVCILRWKTHLINNVWVFIWKIKMIGRLLLWLQLMTTVLSSVVRIFSCFYSSVRFESDDGDLSSWIKMNHKSMNKIWIIFVYVVKKIFRLVLVRNCIISCLDFFYSKGKRMKLRVCDCLFDYYVYIISTKSTCA